MPHAEESSFDPGDLSFPDGVHDLSALHPIWQSSLAAASEVIFQTRLDDYLQAIAESGAATFDAHMLLLLLSFFSNSDGVPFDLFCGHRICTRWSEDGEVEVVDAIDSGLSSTIQSFISDPGRLRSSFGELDRLTAFHKNADQTCSLVECILERIHTKLRDRELTFWRCQALIIAYRAVPWKYLELANSNTKLHLLHLKHTLKAFQGSFDSLSASTRVDIALTLVEASRFSDMTWKRFAIDQAGAVSHGLEDGCLRLHIAQAKSLINRISGNMEDATSSLCGVPQFLMGIPMNRRMHSAIGQAIIQCSLNSILIDELSTAKAVLEGWNPVDQNPSSLEKAVLVRKHMMLARILRLRGSFGESLAHSIAAHEIVSQFDTLFFDEDLGHLVSDHADTLRELNEPWSAENMLRQEIALQDQSGVSSSKSRLQLSLAETLFAQGRFEEAELLCLYVESRPNLLKLEKLRLHITMGKIHHIHAEYEDALPRWSGAMAEMSKFQLTGGRTIQIVVRSVREELDRLGWKELWIDYSEFEVVLGNFARPQGAIDWIPGMRQWHGYLLANY